MQKVLIISYFFPPCKFVGAERTEYWAKNLHKYGFYPIIITRNWNNEQIEITDKVEENTFKHKLYKNYEVYELPYKRTMRDRLAKYLYLKLIQKGLTFIESVLSHFFIKYLPYYNFYRQADLVLSKTDDINYIINSVSPFNSIFISYSLKKKYPDKKFIIDFRDEWTTRSTSLPKNILEKILFYLNRKSEVLWTSNLDYFITVSKKWKENIKNLTNLEGIVIKNGHDYFNFKTDLSSKSTNKLKIIYVGTLYPYQKIELFISAVKKIESKYPRSIQVDFYGTEIKNNQNEKLKVLVKNFENVFSINKRVNKTELISELQKADVGLLTAYHNLQGCLPVKIFDYLYFGLNIFLCPSDNDEMEHFIAKTNSGISVQTEDECYDELLNFLKLKKKNTDIKRKIDIKFLNEYSRNHQTLLFSEFLNNIKNA